VKEKQKILAVDDDPRNVKILLLSLGSEWEIRTANSGEEAMAALETFTPDVILLDIMMPGIDGYEVCKRVRALPQLELTKVVLISGKALLEERLKGYEIGADDYITKPFISEELHAKVRVFMRLAQVERQFKTLNQSLEEEVKSRTDQLLNAKAQLIQSAKMSLLGEMAGGIAHEINTPLGTISLITGQFNEILDEQPLDIEEAKRFVKIIEDTVDRVAHIVHGLRIFSRDGSHDGFVMASVKEIANNTLSLCGEKFRHQEVKLTLEPFPEDLIIECRSTQVSQVILNLLNNACDALEGKENKWITLAVTDRPSQVEIRVTDSGPGIPDEVLEKIFQPFFTTKELGRGTGLGLSISKGLVESHGGSLTVDRSVPNTCFVVTLPKNQIAKAG
jgi:C4-dicarboxylate-specific signal transduction histidine kinase